MSTGNMVLVNVFFENHALLQHHTKRLKVSAHIAELNQTKATCILTVIFVLFNKWVGA
jgi:hypothetical protein